MGPNSFQLFDTRRDLSPSLQQGVGFGIYINIGGKSLPSALLNGMPCSCILGGLIKLGANQGVGAVNPCTCTYLGCTN